MTPAELDLHRWRALGRGGRLPVPADAYAYRFLEKEFVPHTHDVTADCEDITPFDLLSNSEGNR